MNKTAFLQGIKNFSLGNNENVKKGVLVKIKVDSCAICGSDIRIFNHGNDRIKFPAIIGHEISGTVVESKNKNFAIGDRISLGADIPCGKCSECVNEKPNLCKKNLAIGYQLEGGFSEYMNLDSRIFDNGPVVKIDDSLELELACLGEPLACSINGLEKVFMRDGGRVLIFGAGPIGIMLGFLARHLHKAKKIDYVEVNQFRTKSLKNLEIADHIFNNDEFLKQMNKLEGNYDYVFTACSIFETHGNGIKMLANGGAINFFGGLPKPSPSLACITNDIHYKELLLTGSHGSTPKQHAKAIKIIKNNQKFFKSLITHRFCLDEIEEAFDFASSGEGIKVLIKP